MPSTIPQKVINKYNETPGCHPGIILEILLSEIGMSKRQLAIKVNRPYQAINEIIRCRKRITTEIALSFERILPGSAHFWLDLQTTYDILEAKKKLGGE